MVAIDGGDDVVRGASGVEGCLWGEAGTDGGQDGRDLDVEVALVVMMVVEDAVIVVEASIGVEVVVDVTVDIHVYINQKSAPIRQTDTQ